MDRPLGLYTKTKKSDSKTLLKSDKSVTIRVKNLHYHVTEIYKVKNDISPNINKDLYLS